MEVSKQKLKWFCNNQKALISNVVPPSFLYLTDGRCGRASVLTDISPLSKWSRTYQHISYISCWHKLWKGALIWHHCKQEDRFEIFMASFLCSQIDHYPPATYSLPAASDIQFNSPKALFLGKVIGKVSLYNWLIHQVFSENGKHCKHLDNDVCNFCSRTLAGRHWGNPLYISSPLWNSPPFLNAAFSRPAPQMNLRGNADSSQTALIFCLGHPSFSATDLLNKFPGLPTSGFNDSPSIHSNRGTFFQFSDREGIDIISSKCFVG